MGAHKTEISRSAMLIFLACLAVTPLLVLLVLLLNISKYLFKKSVHFSSGVVISPSLFRFVAKVLLCTLYAMEDPFQG